MTALQTALANLSPAELDAVSVLASQLYSSPCPFEDGTITELDQMALEDAQDAQAQPLTLQQIEKMCNLVIPEDIIFTINGQLIEPGTRLNDAMDEAMEKAMNEATDYTVDYTMDEADYPEEEETCLGCINNRNNRYFHSGPGGCLC